MDNIEAMVGEINTHVEAINTALASAKEKGKYTYPLNKAVRMAALEIAKIGKNLRVASLETFKAEDKNA